MILNKIILIFIFKITKENILQNSNEIKKVITCALLCADQIRKVYLLLIQFCDKIPTNDKETF